MIQFHPCLSISLVSFTFTNLVLFLEGRIDNRFLFGPTHAISCSISVAFEVTVFSSNKYTGGLSFGNINRAILYLLPCLPACLPACLPTQSPTYFPILFLASPLRSTCKLNACQKYLLPLITKR